MSCEVIILQEGYSLRHDKPNSMFANGTSNLVKYNQTNLIVDTLGAWDKQVLLDQLQSHHILPDDIHTVVCTHSHPDHVGNLNLFQRAKHIVGNHVYHKDVYEFDVFKDGQIELSKDIKVIQTPGHTNEDVSVVVNNAHELGRVVIAGDLFEKQEDLTDSSIWIEAGSQNEEKQRENRKKVLDLADYIVPGHGSMFKVIK